MSTRRRLVRLVDRLSLAGYPASEALLTRAVRAGVYSLGRATGRLRGLVAPHVEDLELRTAWEEGVRDSHAPTPPRGRVLPFPGAR